MHRINWVRLVLGALVATVILFVTDGFVHETLLDPDWRAVYAKLGSSPPEHQSIGLFYFAVFELGRGFLSMLLYATLRSYFAPGPKTAVLAGIAAWVAFSVAGPAQFIPLGFFSNVLWLKVAAIQLVTSIVATIAGAALYKDATTTAVA